MYAPVLGPSSEARTANRISSDSTHPLPEISGIPKGFNFTMARKYDIPADLEIDFSSLNGFTDSIKELAPYVAYYAIGELTAGRLEKLSRAKVRDSYYHSFEIPKKSGGSRTITAPGGDLKRVLNVLAQALKDIYSFVPSSVHGFVEGCSVATNASCHVGKKYVLNLDLKDFFPSVKKRMVVSSLKKLQVDKDVACLIARLCCYTPAGGGDECLPQGAPTSPILSNIACYCLDIRLSGLANTYGVNYTRYADDMTFSSDHNVFDENGPFWRKLKTIIEECGFVINDRKTRIQRPWERQEVTGISVNNKVNVSRKYLKTLRAELNNMKYRVVTMKEWMKVMGKVNYVRMVRKAQGIEEDYRSQCLAFGAWSILIRIREREFFSQGSNNNR